MQPFDKCPDCGSNEVSTQLESDYKFQYGEDGDAVILRCKQPFRVGSCRCCDFSWTAAGTPEDAEEVMEKTVQDYLSLKERFLKLAEEFHIGSMNISSITKIKEHPAYQQIVSLGMDAVPLLLEAMRNETPPGHWFVAMHDICGHAVNIPKELWGRVREIEQLYIKWGLENEWIA